MTQPLRIAFAGTPDFAARHLTALLSSEHEIIAVYTQPDRPAGRGKKLTTSPVKQVALENNIDVFQPENFKSDKAKQQLIDQNADIMIVVAYGLLLPQQVLDTPRLGCINVHGSILPKWRGAAPIQRSIWAGDTHTGVTIMQMDLGLDTGDILKIASLPIEATDTSATMYEKLADLGPDVLVECLSDLTKSKIKPIKQNDTLANYAKKLSKEEAKINWSQSAEFIERCIRAFNPWPMSYFTVEGNNIKVWQSRVETTSLKAINTTPAGTILKADKTGIYIATGENTLVLEQIQLPGKKSMAVQDILNSRRHWFEVGNQLK